MKIVLSFTLLNIIIVVLLWYYRRFDFGFCTKAGKYLSTVHHVVVKLKNW